MGVGVISLLLYSCKIIRKGKAFYATTIMGVFIFILIPLHGILKRSPVLWILTTITDDKALVSPHLNRYLVFTVYILD